METVRFAVVAQFLYS